ncbi:O-antigen ligase family protein [Arthrobacter sp. M4]|uniref:O-antigen ligase family protein n=1 Tax=Arthrobacter sp. M4 TaxID=218160 RepID=UPI001CDD2774|nr:O-antigen ligase family protein [Arthrobacter sp. M4]
MATLEFFGLRPLGGGEFDRPGALLGNATDQGIVGALLFATLLLPAVRKRSWLLVSGAAAAAITVATSGSRAAFVAGFMSLVILFATSWKSWSQGQRRGVALFSLAAIAAVAVALVVPASRARLMASSTVEGRWLLWTESLALFQDHILTGVGPSRFVDLLPAYHDTIWAAQVGTDYPPDAPHMWILQAATMGGLITLLPVIACAVGTLFFGIRNLVTAQNPLERESKLSYLAAACSYGVALMTAFTSPGSGPLAFFLVGGLVGLSRVPRPVKQTNPKLRAGARAVGVRVALTAAVVVGLVQAIPATIAEWPMKAGKDLVAHGQIPRADQQFLAAAALRPWDADTAMLAAQAFAAASSEGNSNAGKSAVTWAEKALAIYPGSVESKLALAVGLNATGQAQKARDILNETIASAPYNAELYMQRAVSQAILKDPERAVSDARRATELNPRDAAPWNLLSSIYNWTGNTQEAHVARMNAENARSGR